MAEYSSQTIGLEGATLQKMSVESPVGLGTLKLPELNLELGAKGGGLDVDYAREMSAVAEAMRSQAEERGDAGLRLRELELGTGDTQLATVEGLVGAPRLLREAEERIERGEYREALELLDEVLTLSPRAADEHRARYLKALCHSREADLHDALEALLPLRDAFLEDGLATRVEALRAEIRSLLTPLAVMAFLMTSASDADAARARLRDTIRLDPENGMLYFVLAGSLGSDDPQEALEVVEEGLAVAVADRERLTGLREQIRNRLLADLLADALRAFKERRYPAARRRVDELPREWRDLELVQDLRAYLGRLGSVKQSDRLPPPEGPFERVDRLYFLLAREEIDGAKERLGAGNVAVAEKILTSALEFVPGFPYANFLYASCIYRSVAAWLMPPLRSLDFEEQLERLDTAAAAARIAATDPEITAAPRLEQAIGELRTLVSGLGGALESRRREAQAVNTAIEEFQAIMQAAQGGVRDAKHFGELHRRLRALKESMPTPDDVTSDEAKTAVNELGKAVGRNLAQLDSAATKVEDVGAVNKCYDTFGRIMKGVEGGIRNESQLAKLNEELSKLKAQIGRAREQVRDRGGRKALKKLDKAVDKHLKQLGPAVQQGSVGLLVQRFNGVMQELEKAGLLTASPPSGQEELAKKKGAELVGIWSAANTARDKARGKDAKAKLEELEQAAFAVMQHLGKVTSRR
jgi:hypothetical protein